VGHVDPATRLQPRAATAGTWAAARRHAALLHRLCAVALAPLLEGRAVEGAPVLDPRTRETEGGRVGLSLEGG
jgi:hypothetical protein